MPLKRIVILSLDAVCRDEESVVEIRERQRFLNFMEIIFPFRIHRFNQSNFLFASPDFVRRLGMTILKKISFTSSPTGNRPCALPPTILHLSCNPRMLLPATTQSFACIRNFRRRRGRSTLPNRVGAGTDGTIFPRGGPHRPKT